MTPRIYSVALVLVLALLTYSGCTQSADQGAAAEEHRSRLTLAEEPDGGQTVLDVRYALLGEPPEHDHDHRHEDQQHDHADHEHGDHEHDGDEVGDDEDEASAVAADEHDHAHEHGVEGLEHEHEHPVADEDHAGRDHAASDAAEAVQQDDSQQHAHEHGDEDHADTTGGQPSGGPRDVVMVGVVGGVANPYSQAQPEFPFVKDEATVFLADPGFVAEQHAEGHQHAPGEECAFCEAHAADAADAVAMVRFVDDAGKPIKIDARRLLELKPGQTVVVRGIAKVQPGDVLIVDASGLYVRE